MMLVLFYKILSPVINILSAVFGEKATAFVLGVFECTKGLKVLSSFGINLGGFLLCAFICGFGGISVIAQSLAYLKKAKIKTALFLAGKVFQAVISLLIALIIYPICF